MGTVLQLCPPDNGNEYDLAVAEACAALRKAVVVKLAGHAAFAKREVVLLGAANAACRSVLQDELQALADTMPEKIVVDGVPYKRHEDGSVDYHSLCGELQVRRCTYRQVGEHNSPTIIPLELAAGLIEGATPALAYRVALGYAQGPGRRAEEQMHADHREPPSRSTLERMAKAIGTRVKSLAPCIEPLLRQEEELPDGAHAISVGLDRTSVPMEEERPENDPPSTRRKQRTKPYVRAAPPPVDVNYRMAYVGTVSVVDKGGEALITRRYAISGAEDPQGMLPRMMADALRAREQRRLRVGVLQDGSPEMWNLLRGALKQAGLRRWLEGIDRYHLNERLADILHLLGLPEGQRAQKLRSWNEALDVHDDAIDDIAEWIAGEISGHQGETLKKLESHWTFLVNNHDRMRYATLLRAGLPTGSGATEGACKSVVMIRAKGCGQRWHEDGVNAALTLRAVYMSERLPTLWPHFAAEYTADVRAAA